MAHHYFTLHLHAAACMVVVCFFSLVGWRLDRGVRRPDIRHRERSGAHGPVHAAAASARAVQALPGQHEPAIQALLKNAQHAPG
jgi:hypothetical protein